MTMNFKKCQKYLIVCFRFFFIPNPLQDINIESARGMPSVRVICQMLMFWHFSCVKMISGEEFNRWKKWKS